MKKGAKIYLKLLSEIFRLSAIKFNNYEEFGW
jgi:hypothetical protein